MIEDDEKVENAMSLSFLDVISCGMVSSIFLAIIFSVIGYTPAISLRTKDFIAIILELEDGDTQVVNIALKTPEMTEPKFVRLEDFNMITGRYEKDDGNKRYENIVLLGFSGSDFIKDGVSSGNHRIFFISEPAHGKWEVIVSSKDFDSFQQPKELKQIQIITSSKNKDLVIEKDKMERTENGDPMCTFEF